MNKFNQIMEERMLPIASRIASQRHLLALRDGMLYAMPLMIISSIFIIISQFPLDPYQNAMVSIFGESWNTWEKTIMRPATMNFIAVVANMGTCLTLVKSYGEDGVPAAFISIPTYLVLTKLTPEGAWDPAMFGSSGIFVALIVGLLVAEIYRFFIQRKITIKMPEAVPPAVARSFEALIPAAVILTGALLIRLLISLTSFDTIQNFIYVILQQPLTMMGTSLPGTMIAEGFFDSFFWSLGLQGGQLVKSVMLPIWTQLGLENLDAFTAGASVMPHIATKQFIELFVMVGGSGHILPLVIWMLFFAKSQFVKKIGRLSIGPALFNISEPVVFGLPLALNPIMFIPFVLAPMAVIAFTYITMQLHIFPTPVGIDVPWVMPVFLNGFIATNGNLMAIVCQACGLLISFFIWAPFISIYDKQMLLEEMGKSHEAASVELEKKVEHGR